MSASGANPRLASQRCMPRASRACETCRARKTKCDQSDPCSYCAYHSFDCFYRPLNHRENRTTPLRQKKLAARAEQQSSPNLPSPWPRANQSNNPQNPRRIEKESSFQTPPQQAGFPELSTRDTHFTEHAEEGAKSTSEVPIVSTVHTDDVATTGSDICDAASRDGLSGINLHTKGTEFYGNSSNVAFLSNLYLRAVNQAERRDQRRADSLIRQSESLQDISAYRPQESSPSPSEMSGREISMSSKTRVSIVNLFYNANYTGNSASHSPDRLYIGNYRSTSFAHGIEGENATVKNATVFSGLSDTAQVEVEKICINSYFTNKHYIHPMLCKGTFMRRCEQEAWPVLRRQGLFCGATKFAGLYFAVVALGAINASPNETSLLNHIVQQSVGPSVDVTRNGSSGNVLLALDFGRFYVGIAKQNLGDIFESSSLETAQALVLLSVFRQNSLEPHSCYMYSGMAVRTAVAIGLASSMSSLPSSAQWESKRTWWCIYSHEIEMCCSSGRLDSMKELRYYQTSFPKFQWETDGLDPDTEENDIAMIPVMVSLAQIMSEASQQLYHSTCGSMSTMSRLAMDLDRHLVEWKMNIPTFLDLDAHTLNDPEWAFKQKLVLRLRYYNTRILIHRPFLVASTSNLESCEFIEHLNICLESSRNSINMQFESFMHRIYIRTWWYNTTYALYASMILLHLILSNFPGLPDNELLKDVEKSLEIFSSMDNIIVVRRCAEMLREVLEVARTCLAKRRNAGATLSRHNSNRTHTQAQTHPGSTTSVPYAMVQSSSPLSTYTQTRQPPRIGSSTGVTSGTTDFPLSGQPPDIIVPMTPTPSSDSSPFIFDSGIGPTSEANDGNFFLSLFGQDSQREPDRTRADMLANLVDPTILEDFAFGSGEEFSFF